MKKESAITYKELKDWCELHKIPEDTPIAIYDCDKERGMSATGIVLETPNTYEDEEELVTVPATETSGISCYCCNTSSANLLTECNSKIVLALTNS